MIIVVCCRETRKGKFRGLFAATPKNTNKQEIKRKKRKKKEEEFTDWGDCDV
eukprot:m.185971 g.185971  ORF g.185971 m.185971 type:complete len:52 (-) comp13610_c0_seq3:181-336(-)